MSKAARKPEDPDKPVKRPKKRPGRKAKDPEEKWDESITVSCTRSMFQDYLWARDISGFKENAPWAKALLDAEVERLKQLHGRK